MFSPRGNVTRRWKGYDPSSCAISAFEAGRLIGAANYVRSSDQAEVADVAIALAHKDHLRGVATPMLRRLGEAARSNGIRYFVADILAENHPMLKVTRDAGWPTSRPAATPFCVSAWI